MVTYSICEQGKFLDRLPKLSSEVARRIWWGAKRRWLLTLQIC